MISIANLNKSYGAQTLFDGVSLLFGEEATSPKVLAERKKALLDFALAMLGLAR